MRLLSAAPRFSVVEVALVVGAVAHTLRRSRQQADHQPRWLARAWSQGIDPAMVLEACGVAAIFLSVILLLRTRSVAKLLLTLLLLVIGAIATFTVAKNARFASDPDMSALGLGKDGEKDQPQDESGGGGGGGGSGGRPPLPVAVALLQDELPDGTRLFRQTVLSLFAVDRRTLTVGGVRSRCLLSFTLAILARRVAAEPALQCQVETRVPPVDHAQYPGLGPAGAEPKRTPSAPLVLPTT